MSAPERPSRGRLAVRRLVAVALLVGFLGLGVWLATAAVGGESAPEVAPTTAPATVPKPLPVLRVVFPEGFTRRQMVERVAAVRKIAKQKRKITPKLSGDAYAAATKAAKPPAAFRKDAQGIEGFLFPATYEFTPKTTGKQLVADQLEFFAENWAKVDLAYAKTKNLTPYDVLIIASMVERETVASEERAKVAAVIYNRLKARMPLGIDATIRYGLDVPPTESLLESHLADPTPYNTRIYIGLPPTPISNPGLASVQAAAHPAKTDFLFFVRKADYKSHFFTADEDEFYAALNGPRC